MKRILQVLLAATILTAIPAIAQTEISFTAADILKTPRDQLLGEVAGVATNSKGDIFVFTRTGDPSVSLGGSRTFQRGGAVEIEKQVGSDCALVALHADVGRASHDLCRRVGCAKRNGFA